MSYNEFEVIIMNKKIVICTIICAAALLCISCVIYREAEPASQTTQKEIEKENADNNFNIPSEPITQEDETTPPKSDESKEIAVDYKITYYDVINDCMVDFEGTEIFVGEPSPVFFINKLSELMQTRIITNSVVIKGDKMLIDLSPDSAPLNGTGAYEESCILDSISDIMFDVFTDVNKIYFISNGKEYESGHLTLSADIPYEERRAENLG